MDKLPEVRERDGHGLIPVCSEKRLALLTHSVVDDKFVFMLAYLDKLGTHIVEEHRWG